MSGALGVWGRNLRLWVPALAFFLLALGALVFYRTVLADDAEIGRSRLTRRAEELEAVRAERARVESYLGRATGLEDGMGHFYGVRLASEAASLTRLIAEIKDLSERAGLLPQQIKYDRDEIEDEDVLRRRLVFPVEGTYQQLRQLINFLEVSDSFIILEEIGLRGGADGAEGALRIDLTISTLFLGDDGTAIAALPAASEEAAR